MRRLVSSQSGSGKDCVTKMQWVTVCAFPGPAGFHREVLRGLIENSKLSTPVHKMTLSLLFGIRTMANFIQI